MMEDKLTHDERIRLECLALAVASTGGPEGALYMAKRFENYISKGKEE